MKYLLVLIQLLIFSFFTIKVQAFVQITHLRQVVHRRFHRSRADFFNAKPKLLPPDDADASVQPLMKLVTAHFASQALHSIVELGVPDLLGDSKMTVTELSSHLGKNTNDDALFRTLRLLATVGIMNEHFENEKYSFSLTNSGALLQTNVPGQQSLAPCVQHWMERPLWNAWLELADYIAGKGVTELPFDRANGISSDEFYGKKNPKSLMCANKFVRFISDGEVDAVLRGYDWNGLSGKTVVDVGGHYGGIMTAVARKFPDIRCICLDLPEVVSSAPDPPLGVELVGGDVFDPSSIPDCDVIFMKHILDKCMWNEEESVKILQSCHTALPRHGKVIIGEAVLPKHVSSESEYQLQLYIDVLFLLVGRQGGRTEDEWTQLACKAGFTVETITSTPSPSCYLIILRKQEQ